ncbi:MAG TPA: YdeI/OmpD-associated family protein [Terriglobales bacterium]|nr:YdeI/OmpD-associated family protein [Terriglobales bacterium]
MAKPSKTVKPIVKSFSAPLEHLRSGLGWVVAYVPFDAVAVWGSGRRPKVKGEINGFAFRTSLFPTSDGRQFLLINKRMQKEGHAFAGAKASFRLEQDTEARTVTIPAELKRVLAEDRSVLRWFEKLNYSIRKWIVDWITNVKSADARVRRSEQVAEQLMSTMEAERELPPMLQLAFARNPRAREGWERMSVTRRRAQLLAIFYYRTPDSRARRLAKVVEEAAALAEKKAAKRNE